jgi:hypothetical protein
VVRDPLSLVAHWSLSAWDATQVREAPDHHLVLRVFEASESQRLLAQMHLPGDRRIQQVDVPLPGRPYRAELGVFGLSGEWVSIARSLIAHTPVAIPALAPQPPEPTPEASLPETVGLSPQSELGSPESPASALPVEEENPPEEREPEPIAEPSARADGPSPCVANPGDASLVVAAPQPPLELPMTSEPTGLCGVVHAGLAARCASGPSSGEMMSELPGGGPAELSERGGGLDRPSSHALGKGEATGVPFWFRIDADLVVYGATEPDARLVVAGEPVELRPDGTFTLRFALPDGEFFLEAVATSSDGAASRYARLTVRRSTKT